MARERLYQPPTFQMTGRADGERARFYQVVQKLDLSNKESLEQIKPGAIVFLGAKTDIGVSRNLGNPGAKDGPDAIRKALGGIAFHGPTTQQLFDAGDIVPEGTDLESMERVLADTVTDITRRGGMTVVLGGGHEIAKGHLEGLMHAFPGQSIATLNIDAHFDNRPLVDGLGNSGTWATEIHDLHQEQGLTFPILVYGKQWGRNVRELHRRATDFSYQSVDVSEIQRDPQSAFAKATSFIQENQQANNPLYLSLCVDVIDQSYAPGVSARSPLGLTPREVADVVVQAAQSGNVAAFGIAEVNPSRDRDDSTVQSVAQIIEEFSRTYQSKNR